MMNNRANDFFLHSNEVNHISKEDYGKMELLVNAAKFRVFSQIHRLCLFEHLVNPRHGHLPKLAILGDMLAKGSAECRSLV